MAVHTPTPWVVETPMGDETPWIVEAGKKTYEWRCIAMTTSDDPVNDEDRDPVEPLSIADAMANAEFIVKAVNSHDALVKALQTAIRVADEAREVWDKAPAGMKAGKILIALSDPSLHYRADISEMHAVLASIKDRA